MKYQVIVLDLDGTLTNSKKEITPPTRDALIEIQQNGKKVVLASGRPINGVAPLAEELYLKEYGGFMLSFNGARITVRLRTSLPHLISRSIKCLSQVNLPSWKT